MSSWTTFVTKFYKDKKRTTPGYQFKTAMKEAARVYKKNTPTAEGSTTSTRRKSVRTRKSRTRRTRRSRR